MKTYDAIVIGAGPGGYPCAIRLGQLKQKVLCIEKEKAGGVCLNWGCIPSKALISRPRTLREGAGTAPRWASRRTASSSTPNAMQDWKEGIVKKLTGGVAASSRATAPTLVNGTATVTGPKTRRGRPGRRRGGEDRGHEGDRRSPPARRPSRSPRSSSTASTIIGAKEAVSLRRAPEAPDGDRRRRHRPRARHGLPERSAPSSPWSRRSRSTPHGRRPRLHQDRRAHASSSAAAPSTRPRRSATRSRSRRLARR